MSAAWAVLLGAVALAGLAAWWLSRDGWRYDDDVRHRPVRPWTVPLVVALGGVLAGPFYAGRPVLVVLTYALALVWAATLTVIDLAVRRLPDRLTLPAYGVAALLLLGCSLQTGDLAALLRAGACAGAGVATFYLIALILSSREGLGLGDVKLAGVLGLLLGWAGWINAVMGLLGGFVLGGLVAVVLLVLRRADRRSHIPVGPAMLASAYLWCVLPPLS